MSDYKKDLTLKLMEDIRRRRAGKLLDTVSAIDCRKLQECGVRSDTAALIHSLSDEVSIGRNKGINPIVCGCAVWSLLMDGKVSGEALEAVKAHKDGTADKALPVNNIEIYLAHQLAGGVSSQSLRTNLYMRYGHGVSFKPLYITDNGFFAGKNEIAVVEGTHYGDEASVFIPVAGPFKIVARGKIAYFAQGELERLVNSPEIREWRENELEKSKEQENEKEEELDEDLEGGMSY